MTDFPSRDDAAGPSACGIDETRFPLADLTSRRGRALLAASRRAFSETGSLSLPGFLRAGAVAACAAELAPRMMREGYHRTQRHNIYFTGDDPDLPQGHGALTRSVTANRTMTGDQLAGSRIRRVYEWPPLRAFLAALLNKPRLHLMSDPLACLNVIAYEQGEAVNWHFDRAHFTVTLLLQQPVAGSVFQYRPNLRSASDPNYDGVARLLTGADPEVRELPLAPGTLNVFAGRYAAHRVTPVEGPRMRLIAVMSFTEDPGVVFDDHDRTQFYGRAREIGA